MYHELPFTARFWRFLFAIDQDFANAIRKNGCPCGGRLHSADYLRRPRGIPGPLPEHLRIRLSFCCDRDGCRKRVTPPSVSFLGRKVYLGAIVILISTMRQGPSPRRVRRLSARIGVDQRTIARWQVFWREHFPQTPFWKTARAPVCHRLSRASACHTRSWTHSSAVIPPTRAGNSCSGSSHRLRVPPEAFKSRYRTVLRRPCFPAEDVDRRVSTTLWRMSQFRHHSFEEM